MENRNEPVNLEKLAGDLGVEVLDLHMLFVEYCNEMDGEMKELVKYFETEDWKRLQLTIHNVKGVSINLGLLTMHRQAEVIDTMLKKEIRVGIKEEIDKMLTTFSETYEAIKYAFRGHGIEL